jgi:hypothetical protein
MANHQPQNAGNGPPSAGMGIQHGQGGQGAPAASQNMSQQNLNQIVRNPILITCYALSCCIVILLLIPPRWRIETERLLRLLVILSMPKQTGVSAQLYDSSGMEGLGWGSTAANSAVANSPLPVLSGLLCKCDLMWRLHLTMKR